MKFSKLVWWSAVLVSLSARAELSTKTTTCEEYPFFDSTWTVITSNEPQIQVELDNLAKAAGIPPGRVPMTNCRVDFTVDERGTEVDGPRRILTDKLWYDNGVQRHRGIVVHYNETTVFEMGNKIIRKRVSGYSVCRAPDACDKLNIPF